MYDSGRTQGRNDVINDAQGGIAYDGDDYIWSWATYNNTTFATAHRYITTPSTYGSVGTYYEYDDYGNWTGGIFGYCTHCGYGNVIYV